MFGLGFGEIILILVVALLVLGPKKLPGLARQLGRGIKEFQRAASEFQTTMREADSPQRAKPQTASSPNKDQKQIHAPESNEPHDGEHPEEAPHTAESTDEPEAHEANTDAPNSHTKQTTEVKSEEA